MAGPTVQESVCRIATASHQVVFDARGVRRFRIKYIKTPNVSTRLAMAYDIDKLGTSLALNGQ